MLSYTASQENHIIIQSEFSKNKLAEINKYYLNLLSLCKAINRPIDRDNSRIKRKFLKNLHEDAENIRKIEFHEEKYSKTLIFVSIQNKNIFKASNDDLNSKAEMNILNCSSNNNYNHTTNKSTIKSTSDQSILPESRILNGFDSKSINSPTSPNYSDKDFQKVKFFI